MIYHCCLWFLLEQKLVFIIGFLKLPPNHPFWCDFPLITIQLLGIPHDYGNLHFLGADICCHGFRSPTRFCRRSASETWPFCWPRSLADPVDSLKRLWFSHVGNSLLGEFTDNMYAGWWFGTFSIFPYIGNNHPNWLSYFSEGWPNHQPAWCCLIFLMSSHIGRQSSNHKDINWGHGNGNTSPDTPCMEYLPTFTPKNTQM